MLVEAAWKEEAEIVLDKWKQLCDAECFGSVKVEPRSPDPEPDSNSEPGLDPTPVPKPETDPDPDSDPDPDPNPYACSPST